MKILTLLFAITVCFSSSAYAISGVPTVGTDVQQGKTSGGSSSEAIKNNYNDGHTDGNNATDDVGWSREKNRSASIKDMAEARRSNELSASMPASVFIISTLLEYERHPELLDRYPQTSLVNVVKAANYSHPTLGKHIGIHTQVKPGQYSENRANNLRHSGSYGMSIHDIPYIDEQLARNKAEQLIVLGAIGGQAVINANKTISLMNVNLAAADKFKKNTQKKGVHGALARVTVDDIRQLGAGDMVGLFRLSLNQVFISGITDPTIRKNMEMAIDDVNNQECLLGDSAGSITCGAVKWVLNAKPDISINDIKWIGGAFAGYEASYRISGSWSCAEILDKAAGISFASKEAHNYQKNIANSIVTGKGMDFVTESRRGVDSAIKATSGVTIGK